MKILVVHRQKEVIEKLKSVLCNHESIIRFSNSGLDGLLAARIENFDLILCSTDLPVLTGFELTRSIRTNSINKTTPVLFLVDHLDEKTAQLAKLLCVDGIVEAESKAEKLAEVVVERSRMAEAGADFQEAFSFSLPLK